jgi:aquaporin Z
MGQRIAAELIGTFVLVFYAVGSAVFGLKEIFPIGVALAFGFLLLALAYTLGPISGCHVNPAVTLGILLTGGIRAATAGAYIAAQVLGAILAGGLLKVMTTTGGVTDNTGALGTNAWGTSVNGIGAFLFETLGTALLVLVVLVTAEVGAGPQSGLAIGLVLAVIHLVGIPLTGTGVNPARSIGPAVFYWPALPQLWLFIVAPLVGGALAAGVARLLAPTPTRSPEESRA